MEKYLIAFDLDGTLLTDDKKISKLSNDYIQKLRKDGHIVCIATGRPYAGMSWYYKELNLDTPVVNVNGGVTHHPNDSKFESVYLGMDKEIIRNIFKSNKDSIVAAYFSYDNRVYYTSMHPRLEPFIHVDENIEEVVGAIEDTIDVDTGGVVLVVDENKAEDFLDYVNDCYGDLLAVREFHHEEGTRLYELYSKSISKREGLKTILNHYNMTEKNLIAFGDGDNDLEMLEFAYVSVAMINGKEEVLNTAKYITRTTNNEDGAILFLDHFLGYNTLD